MSKPKLPRDTFMMRGLTFRKTAGVQNTWRASTRWGAVDLILTPMGEWFAGFIRHGAYVVNVVNKDRLKAFDRVQLALVELAKLEAAE